MYFGSIVNERGKLKTKYLCFFCRSFIHLFFSIFAVLSKCFQLGLIV